MPKLYLTHNSKTNINEYYTYSGDSKSPVYLTLTTKEIEAYLERIIKSKIKSIRSLNDNLIEVTTENDEIIVIDSIKVFQERNRIARLRDLETNIKESLEASNIANYKSILPKGYIPKVKRVRNKGKYILEDNSIATNLMLSSNYQELSMDLRDIEMYNNESTRGR